MEILKSIKEVREVRKNNKDKEIGFVPTMGFLHEGHQSLIRKAREENDIVVVSIFVNPAQFGEGEDLESYPRDLERDATICNDCGADYIFAPTPEEMYDSRACTYVGVEGLSSGLCGKSRPVHFNGVCLVVNKLFNIVKPDNAYFGQKDAQQLAIIKRFVKDLNIDVNIVGCPIVREEDGLAKSSRNTYLSDKERQDALVLSRSLGQCKMLLEVGERNPKVLIEKMKEEINKISTARIDYIEVVDSETLKEVEMIEKSVLIAMAVYIGKTRLIDNFTFKIGE